MQILNSVPQPCIILGDFNAHGVACGSLRDDGRSKISLDIIDNFRFSILNNGTCTRINLKSNNPSCFDISLCSSTIALNCTWEVVNDPLGKYYRIVVNCMI